MSDYDAMEAGREMDAVIAEKIFGKVRCQGECPQEGARSRLDGTYCYALPDSPEDGAEVHQYSSEIEAAWEVVEKFRQKQWKVLLTGHEWYDGGSWECVLLDALDGEQGRAFDRQVHDGKSGWPEPSAPLAICRAALKAVER